MKTNEFEPSCVVCALDFEQPVSGLLDTAISIAQRFDATLHLVHVWLPSVALTPEGAMIPATSELDIVASSLREQLESVARTVAPRHARVLTKLLPGTPWREIVGYAESHACDLIVAGTHGRTGLARLVEGSVAERVVRASSIPVLIVPMAHDDIAASAKNLPTEEETEQPCSALA